MRARIKPDVSIGQTYNRLAVAHGPYYITVRGPVKRGWYVDCFCVCGKPVNRVKVYALFAGGTASCGCLIREKTAARSITHGMSYSVEYSCWRSMMARCSNPRIAHFKNYGGRGITVCERWHKFENFLEDMGLRPSLGHSIDRIDPNGNYESANCRWATDTEQQRNRRDTRKITFNGETLSHVDWSLRLGTYKDLVMHRLNAGWPEHLAVSVHSGVTRGWQSKPEPQGALKL